MRRPPNRHEWPMHWIADYYLYRDWLVSRYDVGSLSQYVNASMGPDEATSAAGRWDDAWEWIEYIACRLASVDRLQNRQRVAAKELLDEYH